MKRIITVLTIAALMAVMLVAGAGYAFAYAYNDQGNVPAQAEDNCVANYEKQAENEVSAGGGPKAGGEAGVESAPTNCDHFFQEQGAIGKNK